MPFEIVRNDITNMQVDAIVNAASREDRSADTAAVPELAVGCVYDAVYIHFGDALFPDA